VTGVQTCALPISLIFFSFIFGGWGFIWWFFPFIWILPWLLSTPGEKTWDQTEEPEFRKKYYEPDWMLQERLREEPEYLERADGERLQIIDDDGAPPPRLTVG